MIQLSNSSAQIIAPGAAVTFNTVEYKSGNCECFNKLLPTSVKLRAHGGTYEVYFSGNITGTTAGVPVQLAIAVNGTAIPSSVMVYTPATANAFGNVSKLMPIQICCGDLDRISIVNTGTVPVTLSANMNLFIKRVA